MKMEGTFKKPIQRHIMEGVELEMSRAGTILNSKSEWNHSKIPRIIIETGEDQTEDKESGMGNATTKRRKEEEKKRRGVQLYVAEKRGRGEEINTKPPKKINREQGGGGELNKRGDHSIKRGGREIVAVGKVPQEKEKESLEIREKRTGTVGRYKEERRREKEKE